MSADAIARTRGAYPKVTKNRESTIEDLEFLAANSVPADLIAERLGYASVNNLKKVLHRWGRHDLVAMVSASGQPRPSIRQGRVVLKAIS